ncbi:MAG: permease [Acidobacteria bacterium]|nr:permease [Acidobacteriota bacterium]
MTTLTERDARPGSALRERGVLRLAGGALVAVVVVFLYTQLARIAELITYSVLRLERGSPVGSAVGFFVFEVPKVLLLLLGVVFVVGVLRTFLTPETARRYLAGKREASGNVVAALFGIATPFCSCSAVPLFIGFISAGVPLGVTLSFLISAPMVNEVALVLLFGLFGWKVAALYLGTGLTIAIVAGWTIGRLKLERHVEPWVYAVQAGSAPEEVRQNWSERFVEGRAAVREIVGKVWPYVVLGIAVGAGIHGYVPTDFLASFMGREAWWAVPLAVVLGVPMYSNAAGIIPIVQALLGKGAALGTVLAFMMSVIALSLPEMIILRKVLRPVLIAAFIATVAAGILAVGFLFNAVL